MESDSATEDIGGEMQSLPLNSKEEAPKPTSSWFAFLTLDYYQGYFDVSTSQVLERIVAGMFPVRFKLVESLQPNPDLYGPFWLAATLILTAAISGNIANVLNNQSSWEFHFHEVTLIGCCVYTYTWFVPCVLWALLWWRGNQLRYTLLQFLAIYGYSIGIFIPLVVIWLIQNEVVRWIFWAISTLSSGSVLVSALWKPMSQESRKLAVCVLVLVFLLHAGLSTTFKLYYFNSALAPSTESSIISSTIKINATIH